MRLSLDARLAVSVLLLASPALAADTPLTFFGVATEVRPGDAPLEDAFGLGVSTTVIQVSEWQEMQSGVTWAQTTPGYLNVIGSNVPPNFYAPLKFDAGVEVTQVCVRALDTSATDQVVLLVGAFESADPGNMPGVALLETVGTGGPATPAFTLLCATVDPVLRIRTNADVNGNGNALTAQYWVGATVPVGSAFAIGPAIVTSRRTVSPGPATATFTDVPTTHPIFQFVEALAAAGVTGGCGGGNFCPDGPLTRGQMAVFLSAALGLHWPN
jgi:hypothetical protein